MRIILILVALSYNVSILLSNDILNVNSIVLSQDEKVLKHTLPLFQENKGQLSGEDGHKVKYIYKAQGFSIFLFNDGLAYQFESTQYPEEYEQLLMSNTSKENEQFESLKKDIKRETYRMDVKLVGANTNASVTTEGKSSDYVNYYNHNALNVFSYRKLTFHNVYPNIDWVIYTTSTELKYDFIVHPGGDPSLIKLQTKWVENLRLNQDGSLTMQNRMGFVTEQSPVSFQGDKEISTNFIIHENTIQFNLEKYQTDQMLTIDPSLLWSSFYGGNDEDVGIDCVTDDFGNIYLAGNTESTFAIASGGHQSSYGGGDFGDAFIVKFNSSGERQWASYYGGSGSDTGESCSVDNLGNVYLAGGSDSGTGISHQGHQNDLDGFGDAYLVKFNSMGVRVWATYYGGSGSDFANSCFADDSGNIYLAGSTSSTSAIAHNGHQNSFGGGNRDAFLVKFNSTGIRQWATYYGGSEHDRAQSCATDENSNVYLIGYTSSLDNIAQNGYQNIYGGGFDDAFIVKFDSLGERQWASYYGGDGEDVGRSCSVDNIGNVYLAGSTSNSEGLALNGHQDLSGGTQDGFLVKFSGSGIREWATYYGGNNPDIIFKCITDNSNNVFVAGQTSSLSNIASGNYQNSYGGGAYDAFLVKFNSFGTRQWATYFGGTGIDFSRSCASDNLGNVYLVGQATPGSSLAFGGHQEVHGGGIWDAFIVKFEDLNSSIGVNEINTYFTLNGYPNPVNDYLTIDLSAFSMVRQLELYDYQGKLLLTNDLSNTANPTTMQLDMTTFSSGMYTVRVYGDNVVRAVKVVK